MKRILLALVCAFASTASAQMGSYQGPGVLSRGAGDIGDRSGQPVSIRFFADLTGVYDNGIQPFSTDSKGNLVTVSGLYGIQLDFGAYGQHQGQQSLLGLDYSGNFYHYTNNSFYDGTTHNLTLGFTYQKSRRLSFDWRELAGTSSIGLGGGFYGAGFVPTNIVNQPTSLLFDNRTYYVQSSMDVNFVESARTTITIGGDGFAVRRQASGLAGLNGYNLRGSIQHRLSKTKTLGITYQHLYFDFPPAFGSSQSDIFEGFYSTSLGRRWTFNVHAGAFRTDIQGLQIVALNPVVAALLGQSSGVQAFARTDYYPSGSAVLTSKFKTSSISANYTRGITPGNGVYLTSRTDAGTVSYSYTGIRKWNLGVSGGYYKLSGIGQGLQPYASESGGAGFTYGLAKAFHIVGRYDYRRQEIQQTGVFKANSYRATIGLAYSPGNVPLSLW